TQAIFAHDENVYCLSIHSGIDLYIEKMAGSHLGTTTAGEETGNCNIPLLDKSFEDDFWAEVELSGKFYRADNSISAFQTALDNLPWTPDMIMIFSGYDSHREDCGKNITDWTNEDFITLTQSVLQLSSQANCPVLSGHGGGYNLPVTIAAAAAHIKTLANE
ncbi:histone deacetylase, partial [Achromatium sp. WMS3]